MISTIIGYEGALNWGKYPDPSFSVDYQRIDREKLYRDTGYRCNFDLYSAILRTSNWIKNCIDNSIDE